MRKECERWVESLNMIPVSLLERMYWYEGEDFIQEITNSGEEEFFPMYGWMWALNSYENEWMEKEENQKVTHECGFRIYYCSDFGFLLGIDGGGYDFIEAHWMPLYNHIFGTPPASLTKEIADYVVYRAFSWDYQVTLAKLHKILYILQCRYIRETGEYLLTEDFVVGEYGPRLPSLDRKFLHNGVLPIEPNKNNNFITTISYSKKNLIDHIISSTIIFPITDLSRMTKSTKPYLDAAAIGIGSIITKEAIKKFVGR